MFSNFSKFGNDLLSSATTQMNKMTEGLTNENTPGGVANQNAANVNANMNMDAQQATGPINVNVNKNMNVNANSNTNNKIGRAHV